MCRRGLRAVRDGCQRDPLLTIAASAIAYMGLVDPPAWHGLPDTSPLSYVDQMILAPMVRVGTLPMRILARRYGATIVYSEEIIDRKLSSCTRYAAPDGRVEYRCTREGPHHPVLVTYPGERLVLQIGTNDAIRALSSVEVAHQDIRAVDINMGCPKAFSLQGGMGAALLTKPDLVHDIVSTLRRNVTAMPVTCKIRLLECERQTVELARRIEKAGAMALAVHCRYVADRDRYKSLPDLVRPIVDAVDIPGTLPPAHCLSPTRVLRPFAALLFSNRQRRRVHVRGYRAHTGAHGRPFGDDCARGPVEPVRVPEGRPGSRLGCHVRVPPAMPDRRQHVRQQQVHADADEGVALPETHERVRQSHQDVRRPAR